MEREREIDIRRMLYKACMKWRSIVVIAIGAAILTFVYNMVTNLIAVNDEEYVSKLNKLYEAALADYEEEGREIKNDIAQNTREMAEQTDYVNNSYMMKINPKDVWKGSLSLYVDAEYQVMPGSSIQNENPSIKICYGYSDYVTSGEFYEDVMKRLSFTVTEIKYLKEILSINVEPGRYSIIVVSTGVTEVMCQEMLDISETVLKERYEVIKANIADHKLIAMEPSIYSQSDTELELFQTEAEEKVDMLKNNSSSLTGELLQWQSSKNAIEIPILTTKDAVKTSIKWLLIIGIAAALAMFIIYCFGYVISGRIEGIESMPYNLHIISEIPKKETKRSRIDNVLGRIFGVTAYAEKRGEVLIAASYNIGQMYENMPDSLKKSGRIALISDIDNTALIELAGQLALPDGRCKVCAAGNILTDPVAIKGAYSSDAFILVAQQRKSSTAAVEKLLGQLNACGKTILGAVIIETDAL